MIGMSGQELSVVDDFAALGGSAGPSPGPLVPRAVQNRSRRSIARSQERLALISSIRTLGFWSWNAATGRVWASIHARRILGFSAREELTRELLLAALHPSDRAAIVQMMTRPERHEKALEMELRVVGRAPEDRWIKVKARAHYGAAGAIRRVAGYVLDDGQRKRAEAASLKQQQQITHLTRVAMLGELSGALAHELQQPLTAIMCNAQAAQILVAKPQVNVETLREILTDIVSDDKHAGEIIQHLRSLLMRGEMQLQFVQIGDLLDDVLILARSTLAKRDVQLHTHIEPGIPAVYGDRVELQQVLLNLILNACEAMSNNAAGDRRIEISVVLDHDVQVVRTSVLDCGAGIDSEQLERVFDPFFTTKKRGLGLGLGVCQSIITAHKGRLWATNNFDRGAGFHFTIPVPTKDR